MKREKKTSFLSEGGSLLLTNFKARPRKEINAYTAIFEGEGTGS